MKLYIYIAWFCLVAALSGSKGLAEEERLNEIFDLGPVVGYGSEPAGGGAPDLFMLEAPDFDGDIVQRARSLGSERPQYNLFLGQEPDAASASASYNVFLGDALDEGERNGYNNIFSPDLMTSSNNQANFFLGTALPDEPENLFMH